MITVKMAEVAVGGHVSCIVGNGRVAVANEICPVSTRCCTAAELETTVELGTILAGSI